MNRLVSSIGSLSAILCSLSLSTVATANVKGTNIYLPDPAYVLPDPDRTKECDYSSLDSLTSVFIHSGDLANLYAYAAAGGYEIKLEAGGYWGLTHTLYVGPKTILVGDAGDRPTLEATQQMDAVVLLTENDRIDAVNIWGGVYTAHYGVVAQGWTDVYGTPHPMKNIQIWGSVVTELTHYGVMASGGTCVQLYNSKVSGAMSCWDDEPTGGLVRLRSVQYVDLDEVSLQGAHVFGLRGRDTLDLQATWLEVHDIADQNALYQCGTTLEKFRGVGILFENDPKEKPDTTPSVEFNKSYMSWINGYGFFFEGYDVGASFEYIQLTLIAQQNGDAENAVVSVSETSQVCIDDAASSSPHSLLACGDVQVPCQGGIPATPNACIPSQW